MPSSNKEKNSERQREEGEEAEKSVKLELQVWTFLIQARKMEGKYSNKAIKKHEKTSTDL